MCGGRYRGISSLDSSRPPTLRSDEDQGVRPVADPFGQSEFSQRRGSVYKDVEEYPHSPAVVAPHSGLTTTTL